MIMNQTRTDKLSSIYIQKKYGFETDEYVYKNQKGVETFIFLKNYKQLL